MLRGSLLNHKERWFRAALWILPGTLAIAVYFNTLFYGFVWDDIYLIIEDHTIKSVEYLGVIFTHDFFGHQEDDLVYGYFRPLVTLSYALDYAIWQANPFGFHLTNVLLHALSSMLVAVVLLKMSFSRGVALASALIFAVHPLHSENCAWISGRTDIVAFLLTLLAMLAHLRRLQDGPGRRAILFKIAAPLAFGAALIAKEMAIVLIVWLPAMEIIGYRRDWKRSFHSLTPYLAMLAVYLLWRFIVVEVRTPFQLPGIGLFETVMSAPWTTTRYLFALILPIDQSAYIQNPYIRSFSDYRLYIGVAVISTLAFAVFRLRKQSPLAVCLSVMLALSFLPILNFVRAAGPEDMGDMMAERFLYFPSFPFIALVAFGMERLLTRVPNLSLRRKAAWALTILATASAGSALMARNRIWQNNELFYRATLETTPSALIWCNLADHYIHEAKWMEAKAALDKAGTYFADDYHYFAALALWYAAQQQYEKAIALQEKVAAKVKYSRPAAYNNLALLYRKVGNYQRAEALLKEVIDNRAAYGDIYFNLAEVYRATDRNALAADFYRKALQKRPDSIQTASALGGLLVDTGDLNGAADVFENQVRLHGDNPGLLNNLGVVAVKMNRLVQAEAIFRKALGIDPSYEKAKLNLASVLSAKGRTDEAVRTLREIVRTNSKSEEAKTASKLLSDLEKAPRPQPPSP